MNKKTSVILAVILTSLLLVGCDYTTERSVIGSNGREFGLICIDGVEYVQRFTGHSGVLAPHYKQDGSLFICGTGYDEVSK